MINRREVFKGLAAAAAVSFLPGTSEAAPGKKEAKAFTYCLNMATIRGHQLGFIKELETASKAGFTSVEIWIDSLQTYLKNGGTISDARKRLRDLGIQVENAIGFAQWIVDDDAKRKAGIDQMKREMELLAQIGCKRTAAPPAGATDTSLLDLRIVAERYRTIVELGEQTGVAPHLELWGFSKNLSRVSEVMFVAIECGHPAAKVLLDVFHLYKGGSPVDTLSLISGPATDIFHINDYAANIAPAVISDADRIYPSDGVAPLRKILQNFGNREKPLIISFEVFNKAYYQQDALQVAKTALSKMKAVTAGLK